MRGSAYGLLRLPFLALRGIEAIRYKVELPF
jgi:hypothetical protein